MNDFSKNTNKQSLTLLSKEQIAVLHERVKKFRSGRSKKYTWEEVKKMARESVYQINNKKV